MKQLLTSVFNPRENGLVEHWNRALKNGVQAFFAMGTSWEDGMLDLLAQHRSMPATPQGKWPTELFLLRRTRMSFKIVGVVAGVSPDTLHRIGHSVQEHSQVDSPTKHSEEGPQTTKKIDFDRLRPLFRVGDRVLVKAGQVPKGASPYRGPYTVVEVLGRYTF